MKKECANSIIRDLYAEGDEDELFIEQLIGAVKYDENDKDKGLEQKDIRTRTIELIKFFIKDDVFSLHEGRKKPDGKFAYFLVENYLEDNFGEMFFPDDLQCRFVLKKNLLGAMPGEIPNEVLSLVYSSNEKFS